MADIKIKIQYTNDLFYTKEQVLAIKSQIGVLMQRYGYFVENAAKLANVPIPIFQSVIAVENGDTLDVNYVSGVGAVGLVQITPNTMTDVLFRAKKSGRLTAAETDLLLKKGIDIKRLEGNAPILKNGKTQKWYSSAEGVLINTNQLKDVELNLICGAIYLSELIIKYTTLGISGTPEVRLDKVILSYNQGINYYVPMQSTKSLIAKAPLEARKYIIKVLGQNGILQTLIKT